MCEYDCVIVCVCEVYICVCLCKYVPLRCGFLQRTEDGSPETRDSGSCQLPDVVAGNQM